MVVKGISKGEIMAEEEILEKIRQLEVRSSRMKWFGLALVVILVAVLFADRLQPHKTVVTSELLLTDGRGKVVATLSTEEGHACLNLNGQDGLAHAQLCAGDEYGASLDLTTHKGQTRAILSAGTKLTEGGGELTPSLIISERDGEHLVSASAGENTRVLIGHGTERDSIILSSRGRPTISVAGGSGKLEWSVPEVSKKPIR
jgi:hypothetical protein